jgi:hypothetical protein
MKSIAVLNARNRIILNAKEPVTRRKFFLLPDA